jgi:hypothetical protein
MGFDAALVCPTLCLVGNPYVWVAMLLPCLMRFTYICQYGMGVFCVGVCGSVAEMLEFGRGVRLRHHQEQPTVTWLLSR